MRAAEVGPQRLRVVVAGSGGACRSDGRAGEPVGEQVPLRDEVDRAAERVRAVEGAVRAGHDLDLLEVVEGQERGLGAVPPHPVEPHPVHHQEHAVPGQSPERDARGPGTGLDQLETRDGEERVAGPGRKEAGETGSLEPRHGRGGARGGSRARALDPHRREHRDRVPHPAADGRGVGPARSRRAQGGDVNGVPRGGAGGVGQGGARRVGGHDPDRVGAGGPGGVGPSDASRIGLVAAGGRRVEKGTVSQRQQAARHSPHDPTT